MSGMKFEKEIFMKYLIEREASEATKKKYMTDVTTFYSYAAEAEEIDKELLLAYREWLMQHYAVSSVNSMLVALNQYLLAVGLGRWKENCRNPIISNWCGKQKSRERNSL